MLIRVFSDLHLEFAPFEPEHLGEDVVVLAGDTAEGMAGVEWAMKRWTRTPVVYVCGNHEFYRNHHPGLLGKLHDATNGTNLHVLENRAVTIDGYCFAGCTLWTDFRIMTDAVYAAYHCSRNMNDFRAIRTGREYRRFRPDDAAGAHARSRDWLTRQLSEVRDRTIVVTHHAPHELSIPRHLRASVVSSAYASNLSSLLEQGPRVWIHGHVHDACDYTVGTTRVMANPRGYPGQKSGFQESLIIEVP